MIRGTAIDFALGLMLAIRRKHFENPRETFNTRVIAEVANLLHEEGFGHGVVRHQDIFFLETRAMQSYARALIPFVDQQTASKLRAALRRNSRFYIAAHGGKRRKR